MVLQNKDQWIELEEAQQRILENIPLATKTESVPLEAALGRVLAKDFAAEYDVPSFHRSPLDGYALRSEDSKAASENNPVQLCIVEEIFAGDVPSCTLKEKDATRIMTGAMLPKGADCVIKQEEIESGFGKIQLTRALGPKENFVACGEDVRKGDGMLLAGQRLGPAQIGLLAGQGVERILVFQRPRVAVIATGNELINPGEPLEQGKIFDSNSFLLASRVGQLGATLCKRGVLKDEADLLRQELNTLLQEVDLVITTGGVSVGERDYLPKVAKELGGTVLFHGLQVRPGGPALALSREGRTLLCLSGNPFAALATFEVLAGPLLKKLAGESNPHPRRATAFAETPFDKSSPTRRLIRARVEGKDVFIPSFGHASGSLYALMDCNCLIDLPKESGPVAAGDMVKLILFD